MSYGRYFPTGQKVFLRRVFAEEQRTALDTMTGYLTGNGATNVDISLPYGSDAANDYPFEPGMRFELLCDHKGMGLRLQTIFQERLTSRDIRLQFAGHLEFITRRQFRRLDVTAWVGIKRGLGNLDAMRTAWEEHYRQLQSGVSPGKLVDFRKCLLNLAGGGMCLPVKAPVGTAELLLVFLSLGDKQGIICTLTEAVWTGQTAADGTQPTGLRFLNIRHRDQDRIDRVVTQLLNRLEQGGG